MNETQKHTRGVTMSLILQHADYRTLWECRILPHPITVRGNRWLAVLRVGPWSLILARRVAS